VELGRVGETISVNIDGPSKNPKVEITDHGNGRYTLTFITSHIGNHLVTICIRNQPIKNSPFNLVSTDQRDPKSLSVKPVLTLGQNGQLSHPAAVAVNSKGEIVVVDRGNNRVQIYSKDGKILRKFGSAGKGKGQFSDPYGLDLDGNDNIYVADFSNNRVQIFSPTGIHMNTIGDGPARQDDGQFLRPIEVCVNRRNGEILVADYDNHRVQIFNSNGQFLRKFGSSGNLAGQLMNPKGLGVNSKGEIVVGEFGNNRLQIFDSNGNHVRFIGSGQLVNPGHLCLDDSDNIYVCERSKHVVKVFEGKTGQQVHFFGGTNSLFAPEDVAIDPLTRVVYVVNEKAHNVYAI